MQKSGAAHKLPFGNSHSKENEVRGLDSGRKSSAHKKHDDHKFVDNLFFPQNLNESLNMKVGHSGGWVS